MVSTAAARGVLGSRARPLLIEAGLLVVLFAFYKWGRTLVEQGPGQAMSNAAWLWGFERSWLPSEVAFQHWALGWEHTAFLANVYYVGVHFPGTALLLIWLYVRHRQSYARVRNELVVLTAAGLAVHMLFPLAPPRLAGIGAVDTMLTVGPSAYPAAADGIANQYAAMPSLHIGWAVLVAVAVLRVSRSRWRWAVALHAPVTVLVVVVTANHYWTDGIVAAVLLAGAMALVAAAGRLRRGPGGAAAPEAVAPTALPALPAPGRSGEAARAARPAAGSRAAHGDREGAHHPDTAHHPDAADRDDELVPA